MVTLSITLICLFAFGILGMCAHHGWAYLSVCKKNSLFAFVVCGMENLNLINCLLDNVNHSTFFFGNKILQVHCHKKRGLGYEPKGRS
jgi:hypothetical protein